MSYGADAHDAVNQSMQQDGAQLRLSAGIRCRMGVGDFRSVDIGRLVIIELMPCVTFEASQVQEVLARWFPGAKFQEMKVLRDVAVGSTYSSRKLAFPHEGNADHIRSYFGGEVVVVTNFVGFCCHWVAGHRSGEVASAKGVVRMLAGPVQLRCYPCFAA